MATISGTSRPGYVWDSTDNVWYPIGTGVHTHDYIPTTLSDAKGDLLVGTADNTIGRLAVGNSGEQIVADSAATTGLRYSATPSASNPVLNSAMQVWQRGTSISIAASGNAYTADRWCAASQGVNTAITISRQATNDTTNLPNIQYCSRVQRNSGQTGTSAILFVNSSELVNAIPFAGKTITMSFYARAGANFSGSSIISNFIMGTGTDQNRALVGYTGETSISGTATLTTTWQRFTFTGNVGATVTEFATYFSYTGSGTAGTNDYFEITGVQIDIGSVALPFRTYAATIQGELAACQRYYVKITGAADSLVGACWSASAVSGMVELPATMRVAPTVTLATTGTSTGNITWTTSARGFPATIGTITAASISINRFNLAGSGFTAGFVGGNSSILYLVGSGTFYEASAEL